MELAEDIALIYRSELPFAFSINNLGIIEASSSAAEESAGEWGDTSEVSGRHPCGTIDLTIAQWDGHWEQDVEYDNRIKAENEKEVSHPRRARRERVC